MGAAWEPIDGFGFGAARATQSGIRAEPAGGESGEERGTGDRRNSGGVFVSLAICGGWHDFDSSGSGAGARTDAQREAPKNTRAGVGGRDGPGSRNRSRYFDATGHTASRGGSARVSKSTDALFSGGADSGAAGVFSIYVHVAVILGALFAFSGIGVWNDFYREHFVDCGDGSSIEHGDGPLEAPAHADAGRVLVRGGIWSVRAGGDCSVRKNRGGFCGRCYLDVR